jgi:hypothetical protein
MPVDQRQGIARRIGHCSKGQPDGQISSHARRRKCATKGLWMLPFRLVHFVGL